jgi:hypothetical protein
MATTSTSWRVALRQEFKWDKIHFTDVIAWNKGFTQSWVFKDEKTYLTIRITFAILVLGILLWSSLDMAVPGDYEYWWIYLTHWTLVVESMYFVSAAYTTWRAFTNKEQKLSADKHMILSWVLHDIAYPSTCLVMIMFWGLVFSPPVTALTTFTHGVNFIVMLVDVILSSQPYYIMHAVYFLSYAAIYIGWTLFFYAVKARNEDGDRYVYSALDYKDDLGGALVSIAIAFFFLIPLQLPLLWSVVHFRTRKANHKIQDNGTDHDATEVEMANRISVQV